MIVKVLSVQQPWASLICSGIKSIENRTWKTEYRGRLYIHASKKWSNVPLTYKQSTKVPFWMLRNIQNKSLPIGKIIGHVDLVDIITNSESFWAQENCYHWQLENSLIFLNRIECKGKLRIWDYDLERIKIK
jgi:hypothetical protein